VAAGRATALFSTTTRGFNRLIRTFERSGLLFGNSTTLNVPWLRRRCSTCARKPSTRRQCPDRLEWKNTSLGWSASGGIATVMSHLR
jgi:hypothetical protein